MIRLKIDSRFRGRADRVAQNAVFNQQSVDADNADSLTVVRDAVDVSQRNIAARNAFRRDADVDAVPARLRDRKILDRNVRGAAKRQAVPPFRFLIRRVPVILFAHTERRALAFPANYNILRVLRRYERLAFGFKLAGFRKNLNALLENKFKIASEHNRPHDPRSGLPVDDDSFRARINRLLKTVGRVGGVVAKRRRDDRFVRRARLFFRGKTEREQDGA